MNGRIAATCTAAALDEVPQIAGSASELIGSLQYGSGIISSILLAVFSKVTPWTMTWIMMLFTTAWPYHDGESETLLGKALQNGYREKVKIATKLPTWMIESREDMDKFLNEQLKKLGTDHIDYYLIHALSGPSWEKIEGQGVRNFLDQAPNFSREF